MAYKKNRQKDLANTYFRKAIEQKINPGSVATIYKAQALRETGHKTEGEKLVRNMFNQLSADDNKMEPAMKTYLESLAYDYLGEKEKAEELMTSALDLNYNVAMEARYNSSFLTMKKMAME
jgi:hypothetical protein